MCWKPCSSCWSFDLLREEFLSAPIHSSPLWFAVSVLQPLAEPVEEGDEGIWDTVGEPVGSRSPAPTVEEILAQLERQPPAPQGARSP
jgi:hypothetical protein